MYVSTAPTINYTLNPITVIAVNYPQATFVIITRPMNHKRYKKLSCRRDAAWCFVSQR